MLPMCPTGIPTSIHRCPTWCARGASRKAFAPAATAQVLGAPHAAAGADDSDREGRDRCRHPHRGGVLRIDEAEAVDQSRRIETAPKTEILGGMLVPLEDKSPEPIGNRTSKCRLTRMSPKGSATRNRPLWRTGKTVAIAAYVSSASR